MLPSVLTTGIFPDAFKVAKIIPIFKKGDSSLLVNYRPISLLPTISKVFERVIHDQMYEYFNNFNFSQKTLNRIRRHKANRSCE